MKIEEPLLEGKLVKRDNRFVASVIYQNKTLTCHLHETGRLRELAYPNNDVLFVQRPGRKTCCKIIAMKGSNGWVITNTALHRNLATCLFPKEYRVKPEVKLYESRIDFFIEPNIFVETKGITLVKGGVALFPDAPTERGRKHLKALISAVSEGYKAMIWFLVMRDDAQCYYPNYLTDEKFESLFFEAIKAGVESRASLFKLKNDGSIYYIKDIDLCKSKPLIL